MMGSEAIALLEVQANVAAIAGLDAMVKAANVHLIHVERRLGGRLVTVVVEGTVSDVTAALEAGRAAASSTFGFPGRGSRRHSQSVATQTCSRNSTGWWEPATTSM